MTKNDQWTNVPTPVLAKLHMVRRHMTVVSLWSASVGALAALLAAMMLAMLADWLLTLFDPRWRMLLNRSALGIAALTFLLWAAAALLRGRNLTKIAADVDREIPELEERWSTVTEISTSAHGNSSPAHPGMLRNVSHEAVVWEPRVEPREIVSLQGLLQSFYVLCGLATLLALAVLVDWRQTTVLLGRFWAPRSNISLTQINGLEDTVAPRGEPLSIEASLTGRPVDRATMFRRPSDGAEETLRLFPKGDDNQHFTYHIRAASQSFGYRLRAGDGQSPWYHVTVADRPELAAARLRIAPPTYTGHTATELRNFPDNVSALAGSTFEIALRASGPLSAMQLQLDIQRSVSLVADPDGWYRWQTVLEEDLRLSPILTELNGLTNRHPPLCRIDVFHDKPPAVQVLSPDEEIAVLPDDTIEIQFAATDDYGIGRAELVVYDDSERPDGQPIPLQVIDIPLSEKDVQTSVQGKVKLELAALDLQDGEAVNYAIRVYDSRKVPVPEPQRILEKRSEFDALAVQKPNGVNQPNEQNVRPPAMLPAGSGNIEGPRSATNHESRGRLAVRQEKSIAHDSSTKRPQRTTTASQSDSASGGRLVVSRGDPSTSQREQGGAESPGDNMLRRLLEAPQNASSNLRRITVDKWAGSFDGQQRHKLEIAIAPVIEELDRTLAKAETQARGVLDELEKESEWLDRQDQALDAADQALEKGAELIEALHSKTLETPYAFIGLQLVEIGQSHMVPARDHFWAALESADEERVEGVRGGWQHIGRARQLLAELTRRFEQVRRDYQLAESMQKIKRMYRVFLEDSFALLQSYKPPLNPKQRKIAEFELDDEYLKRLREVLEMRRDLMAELARILAEDPRLLRRYMDLVRRQSDSLRDQLTLLATRQQALTREFRAHVQADKEQRAAVEAAILKKHLLEASEISSNASDLYDRFLTWLPLDVNIRSGALADSRATAEEIAAKARTLALAAAAYQTPTAPRKTADKTADEPVDQLPAIRSQARAIYQQLRALDTSLRRVSLEDERDRLGTHIFSRLTETRQLTTKTSGWIHKIEQLEAGNYHLAAAVDQHQLAVDTDQLAGRLADIQQVLASTLECEGPTLSKPIADKAQELLGTFDNVLANSLLAAEYALQHRLSTAAAKQDDAIRAFAVAENQFDQLLEMAIEELDKLPVQDPIADLLDDPTLDELLRMLENEPMLAEALGIPCRPTNLQIIDDWLRPGDGGNGRGGAQMMMAQLQQQDQQDQRQLERIYQQALARALKEKGKEMPKSSTPLTKTRRWNTVVAKLADELLQGRGKQPPERYRRAIEQYFDQISRNVAGEAPTAK